MILEMIPVKYIFGEQRFDLLEQTTSKIEYRS